MRIPEICIIPVTLSTMSTSRYLFKFNVEDMIPLYLSEQIAECTEDINGVRRQTASKTKPAIKKTSLMKYDPKTNCLIMWVSNRN